MSERMRLISGKIDESIIDEMIGSVDKEKMQIMMSVAATHLNSKQISVSMSVVDEYLKRWAHAKYDFYLAFGKKLKLSNEIETKMSVEQMRVEIDGLCKKYPQYALLLKSFQEKDFVENSFSGFKESGNPDSKYVLSMYEDLYFKKKCKVSSALSAMIQDKGETVTRVLEGGRKVKSKHTFDIELSKVLQTKFIKGTICVSIDPLDYLMMSTNKHGWNSCMSISPSTTGYNNVVLSKITDESTVIGFKCNDSLVPYDLDGFQFEYISMQVRYTIFIDKMTGAVGVDNGYGGENLKSEELKTGVLKLLMDQLAEYCDVPNVWDKKSRESCAYSSDGLSYTDGVMYLYVNKQVSSKSKRQPYFDIGVKSIVCPHCGKTVTNRGNFICCADRS